MSDNAVVSPPSTVIKGARRASIIAIVVSLAISAVLGIIALLSGEFGWLQGQVLLTTLTIAAFGTTALCHLAIVTRAVRVVGFIGIVASLGAAVAALLLIWVETSDDGGFIEVTGKLLVVLGVIAVSLAQANLLLLLADRPQRLIRIALLVTLVAIAILAVMILLPVLTDGEIPGDDGEPYWRALGVVSIIDALGTIALPIVAIVLRRSGSGVAPAAAAAPIVAADLRLELPAALAARLDAHAARTGATREQAALAVLEAALPAVASTPLDAP